jgi:hypothetical protein
LEEVHAAHTHGFKSIATVASQSRVLRSVPAERRARAVRGKNARGKAMCQTHDPLGNLDARNAGFAGRASSADDIVQ